jgi:hypothetical protein
VHCGLACHTYSTRILASLGILPNGGLIIPAGIMNELNGPTRGHANPVQYSSSLEEVRKLACALS